MPTEVCTKCGAEKDIEEFPLRNRFASRRQSYCKDCRSIMGGKWYERIKDCQKENARSHRVEYRQTAKEYVWDYLLTHPCINCAESDSHALGNFLPSIIFFQVSLPILLSSLVIFVSLTSTWRGAYHMRRKHPLLSPIPRGAYSRLSE
jgi:hypothetical protein